MISPIVIPSLGATGSDVVIDRWLVAEGDFVPAGTPVVAVVTDKATVEVEAFRQGYVRKLVAPEGAAVAIGEAVAYLADAMDEAVPEGAPGSATPPPGGSDSPLPLGEGRGVRAEDCIKAPIPSPPTPLPEGEGSRQFAPELGDEALLTAFGRMTLIRRFEDYLYQLFLQGLVPGTLHQCQGQEAVAVGVCAALRADDWVFSTHRPVGHFLAKGCPPERVAAEIWGKATGCAGGKGGQMHLADLAAGLPPSNAIVGANVPIATGAALAFRLQGTDRVAVSFFGDGAANIGALHEGINLAAVKNAPVVFVCENNLYGASTHQSVAMRVADVARRAEGYGIPGVVVDGMDVTAVYRAAAAAVDRARGGLGPTLIECKTYRFQGHSRGDPGGYRSKEEVAQWRARDPLPRCRRVLIEAHGRTEAELAAVEAECQRRVEEAVRFAQASPEPGPAAVMEHVFAPRETNSFTRDPSPGGRGEQVGSRPMGMAEALRDGLRIALRRDPRVFVLGEDVGVPGGFGGGFTVTLGLSDEFGHDRIMDTPISEIAIVGAAVGAAMAGCRPVAEMQYGDFVFCAMDPVVNQAAKMRYMSNGQVAVPLVLRLPVGASGRGAQHGQCSEAFFLHTPGLKVVCPSTPYDAKGMLLAAIRDGNPVVFLEHKMLYGAKGGRKEKTSADPVTEVPLGDYEVPLGSVAVRRTGRDLTVLANMLMVYRALAAAEDLAREGIDAEVIDIRSLVPLDFGTIAGSVRKTSRVLIVEEDNRTGGWGAEVAARLAEAALYHLDAPVVRVAAPDTPLPCAAALEREYVPDVGRIVAAARRLVREG